MEVFMHVIGFSDTPIKLLIGNPLTARKEIGFTVNPKKYLNIKRLGIFRIDSITLDQKSLNYVCTMVGIRKIGDLVEADYDWSGESENRMLGD